MYPVTLWLCCNTRALVTLSSDMTPFIWSEKKGCLWTQLCTLLMFHLFFFFRGAYCKHASLTGSVCGGWSIFPAGECVSPLWVLHSLNEACRHTNWSTFIYRWLAGYLYCYAKWCRFCAALSRVCSCKGASDASIMTEDGGFRSGPLFPPRRGGNERQAEKPDW